MFITLTLHLSLPIYHFKVSIRSLAFASSDFRVPLLCPGKYRIYLFLLSQHRSLKLLIKTVGLLFFKFKTLVFVFKEMSESLVLVNLQGVHENHIIKKII